MICCARDCRYQTDGICTLVGGASVTNLTTLDCPFFLDKPTSSPFESL